MRDKCPLFKIFLRDILALALHLILDAPEEGFPSFTGHRQISLPHRKMDAVFSLLYPVDFLSSVVFSLLFFRT